MPLDTSTYSLAHLRLDGRRWNELRRIHGAISTQASADGSSYLEMGNTKVICTVDGPAEIRSSGRQQQQQEGNSSRDEATVTCEILTAGFSDVDRKRRGRADRRTLQTIQTITQTFSHTLFTHLYPHSTIALTIHILSQDGSLLAACLNATTLALIDAGVGMRDYVAACTCGLSPAPLLGTGGRKGGEGGNGGGEEGEPLLDLNGMEEGELGFLTVGTLGAASAFSTAGGKGVREGDDVGEGSGGGGGKVVVCVLETKVPLNSVEGMLAVGVDGCARVRGILDGVVRERGNGVLGGGKKGETGEEGMVV